ncbi:hypothetical protein [Nonomuraea rhodomycinica]|uniref:Uncharacterized protein n=1 Tax=Nonomuraea rhodomycinica TaxID=1712872 RepID=A0A7Y6IKI7_9ACTN|nr:hypothetical protein [Nonomuraea rhodomycinica]NUW39430.1 hypothetical protein [Nonomuraea rhodomycinica]
MKFLLKAEFNPPRWLIPVAHTTVAGGGMVYTQLAEPPASLTTAVVFVMGVSYGRILNAWGGRKTTTGPVDRT